MNGEAERDEKGPRGAEFFEQSEDEKGVGGVEKEVDEVVAGEIGKAEELVFNPEGRDRERIILLVGARVGPGLPEGVGELQRGVERDVGEIVPLEGPLE